MFNTQNFDEFIKSNPKLIREEFDKVLTTNIDFLTIEKFPKERGLYFLYLSDSENTLLYIGSTYGGNRTIYERCRQYLQKGCGGESFRGKIANLKNISEDDAVQFIKDKVKAKFILLNDFEEIAIRQIEQVAVWSYQPPLNFVLKKFNFKQLEIVIE